MTADLVRAVAERLGAPEDLVLRSAQAHAQAMGVDVEQVLQAWAGGGDLSATPSAASTGSGAATPAEAEAAPAPAEAAPTEAAPAEAAPAAAATPAAAAPSPAAPAAPAASVPEPAIPLPETVTPDEAAAFDAVTVVPRVGLKERVAAGVPGWLLLLFILLPALSAFYVITNPSGECGEAGALSVDRFTGEPVNCDGTPVAIGEGAAGPSVDYVALGAEIYAERAGCAACHGANGEGGVGPALAELPQVFPTCQDQIRWVTLGSSGWQQEVGTTYGATGKPVQGGMPGFGTSLSAEEIAAVVLYERVQYGRVNLDEALADCGLAGGGESDGGATALPALDTVVATGQELYGTCAACHGPNGEGGVGPALAEVLDTFPSCQDHIAWVSLGSSGWQQEVGDTYGATGKPVKGGMPGFSTLSEDEVRAIVTYERIQFGRADAQGALADCYGG